jgi:predicted SAM-dependent methyltransferase
MRKKSKKLHLGCGLNTPVDWVNLDGSFNAWLTKYPIIRKISALVGIVSRDKIAIPWSKDILIHDVRKPLPFADNSMEVVYASHLLEHLYCDEAEKLLRECFRVLSPGGVLRLMVPDLQDSILQYLEQKQSDTKETKYPADVFIESLSMRPLTTPVGNWIYKTYNALKDFHSHKWMYDAESLEGRLRRVGFVEVGKKALHESRIKDIKLIELNRGLCVEGSKPL